MARVRRDRGHTRTTGCRGEEGPAMRIRLGVLIWRALLVLLVLVLLGLLVERE